MTLEAERRTPIEPRIEVSETGAALVVRLTGRLDARTRQSTEAPLLTAVASGGSVIVDLTDVEFCDSSGVAMFIAIAPFAESQGTRLSIRNAPPNVRRIFEIAGLDHEIDLRDG